ncbi:hypothetical protein FQN57_000149 [Myotisia sp. PD_48]|nr:hypothetical protein FQN57_000149 [Myotisia sp. PD_48]
MDAIMKHTSPRSTSDGAESEIPVLESPALYQQHQQGKQSHAPNTRLDPQHHRQQRAAVKQHRTVIQPIQTRQSNIQGDGQILKELRRGAPTDDTRLSNHLQKSAGQLEQARRRSQYFDEAFSSREPYHTPRSRVSQDSVVVVEIKTNNPIDDPAKFISDFLFTLAQMFQRPEGSIMIILNDRVHLMFGSSDEPAYLITISALSCMVAPVTNMRHTILVQDAIRDYLDIPPYRGVVKFESLSEENIGTNRSTVKDEIEKMERTSVEEHSAIRNFSRTMSRRIKPTLSRNSGTTALTSITSNPLSPIKDGSSVATSPEPTPVASEAGGDMKRIPGSDAEKANRNSMLRKCKSIKQFFTR